MKNTKLRISQGLGRAWDGIDRYKLLIMFYSLIWMVNSQIFIRLLGILIYIYVTYTVLCINSIFKKTKKK